MPGHVRDHFREEADVDWDKLARRQRDRLGLADAWWGLAGGRPGLRLADVGCGPGILAHRYAELGGDVLAVDLRPEAIARLPVHPRLHGLVHDIERAPLPQRVDAAILTDVLHHAREPAAMLRHLRASAARLVLAEFDPDGPGDVGPPREARIAAQAAARLLREAGWAPGPAVAQPEERYVILAA